MSRRLLRLPPVDFEVIFDFLGCAMLEIFVVVMILAIIGSLFSGLYFLSKSAGGYTAGPHAAHEPGSPNLRVAKALTWRIGLSAGLFVILLTTWWLR